MKWQDFIWVIKKTDIPKLRETDEMDKFMRISKDVILLLNLAIEYSKKAGEYDECVKEIMPIINELGYEMKKRAIQTT